MPDVDFRLRCPKDSTLMEKVDLGGTTADRCNRCGALWLDRGELERILALGQVAAALDAGPLQHQHPGHLAGARVCPRDQTPLREAPHPTQPHVRLDACPECRGLLLDAGELKDLSQFTLMERLRSFCG
jgi:Zn-finger nucleic acid-binding protein